MRRGLRIAALAACALALVSARGPDSLTERNRAVVTDFARLFYTERNVRAAFERYVAADYIQHNPAILDGREAAIAMLEPKFSAPSASFDVKRILVDGDMAMIHLHGRPSPDNPGGTVADIYRLKDGRIVEHWDVLQPIQTKTVNPHPYF
ncbi:nuclear transport factor 2 family protein [Novosphingobium clariflavum]|uniref:Nuclear transport factor 2 family protein n=1 Tax=Novosphingobium clariflavum TaxID=2029884 RepID=A0ABV6SBG4_9SPHN|nr:nuclear transport factor 2 family protein [Novosphingobium clariflavum]